MPDEVIDQLLAATSEEEIAGPGGLLARRSLPEIVRSRAR
jgi:hypothetical protein